MPDMKQRSDPVREPARSAEMEASPPRSRLRFDPRLLEPADVPIDFFGCDFDEMPPRFLAQERLEPMLRYLRQGDTAGALRAMEQLCRRHPGRNFHLLELGVQLAGQGRIEEAMGAFDDVLDRNPEHADALKYKAFLRFLQGDHGQALELFGKSLALQPDDCFANLNFGMLRLALAPGKRRATPEMPPTAVCTSLPPRNVAQSRTAVTSWLEREFTVFSVNTRAEVEQLAPHFPDVRFHVCENTARERFGRDFQYLDTVMDCLLGSDAAVLGIVNADIIMRGEAEDWAKIAHSGLAALTYGSRANVHASDDRHGWLYEAGYDFFFFPRELARQVPATEYALGLPWWDIFFPCWAMALGYPIAYVYSPVAMHPYHPMKWDFNLYYDMGLYTMRKFFAPLLGAMVAANPGRRRSQRRLITAFSFTAKRTPRGVSRPVICASEAVRGAYAPIDPGHWLPLEYETLVRF